MTDKEEEVRRYEARFKSNSEGYTVDLAFCGHSLTLVDIADYDAANQRADEFEQKWIAAGNALFDAESRIATLQQQTERLVEEKKRASALLTRLATAASAMVGPEWQSGKVDVRNRILAELSLVLAEALKPFQKEQGNAS